MFAVCSFGLATTTTGTFQLRQEPLASQRAVANSNPCVKLGMLGPLLIGVFTTWGSGDKDVKYMCYDLSLLLQLSLL